MKRQNIILITLDGVRVDRIRSVPFLDSCFSRGTLFSNMITYAPSTIASMHSIFSGEYGSNNGVNNYWASSRFRKDRFKTITQHCKEAGYYTRGDIINELIIPHDFFDKLTIHNEYQDDLFRLHSDIIGEAAEVAKGGKNIFLYLHYSYIHARTTINVMDKYPGEYNEEYFSDKERNSRNFDVYMTEADEYLKAVFAALENNGLLNDSTIVLCSDHGTGIGEKIGERRYGVFCYDYTLKTFALFINPLFFPEGREVSQMVRTVDILPTLLDTLGIESEVKIEGRSLLPVIQGGEKSKRLAFSETATLDTPSRREPNIGSIRSDRYKLIYNKITKTREFYNLLEDPSENENLAGKGIEEEDLFWFVLKDKMNL